MDVFLGSIEGERDEARASLGVGRGTVEVWVVSRLFEALVPLLVLVERGMMDMRFILLASVGLTVRAPRPVAWDACRDGAIDMRFEALDWTGVDSFAPFTLEEEMLEEKLPVLLLWLTVLGGRGKAPTALLGSWTADMDALDEATFWKDLALDAREPLGFLKLSLPLTASRLPSSRDERAVPVTERSELDVKLGRLLDVVLDTPAPALYSGS